MVASKQSLRFQWSFGSCNFFLKPRFLTPFGMTKAKGLL